MEHPFYGSWGYQTTGYFAPTSRYGTPQDFMYLVDVLHQHEIGVILDWVPSHFPNDEHGLAFFDGTHLYEHADPRQGIHPEWNSYHLQLRSPRSPKFPLEQRPLLAWASIMRTDCESMPSPRCSTWITARKPGEWVPNEYGGRENLEAISFLRRLNEEVYRRHPGRPDRSRRNQPPGRMVSRPPYVGGLGFGYKWDMGWMHDTLEYMAQDPVFRKYHHDKLTFRMLYAFHENFVLPLSHDEVVYGKGSLLEQDAWGRLAEVRELEALFGYMYGACRQRNCSSWAASSGNGSEWVHDESLDWHLLASPRHQQLQDWVARFEPALPPRAGSA